MDKLQAAELGLGLGRGRKIPEIFSWHHTLEPVADPAGKGVRLAWRTTDEPPRFPRRPARTIAHARGWAARRGDQSWHATPADPPALPLPDAVHTVPRLSVHRAITDSRPLGQDSL